MFSDDNLHDLLTECPTDIARKMILLSGFTHDDLIDPSYDTAFTYLDQLNGTNEINTEEFQTSQGINS